MVGAKETPLELARAPLAEGQNYNFLKIKDQRAGKLRSVQLRRHKRTKFPTEQYTRPACPYTARWKIESQTVTNFCFPPLPMNVVQQRERIGWMPCFPRQPAFPNSARSVPTRHQESKAGERAIKNLKRRRAIKNLNRANARFRHFFRFRHRTKFPIPVGGFRPNPERDSPGCERRRDPPPEPERRRDSPRDSPSACTFPSIRERLRHLKPDRGGALVNDPPPLAKRGSLLNTPRNKGGVAIETNSPWCCAKREGLG
jgi:hypothetical protein